MRKPNTYKYTTLPVRPTREPFLARIGKVLAFFVVVLIFGVLIPLFLVEWMAGCGETYTDAKGKMHTYECVFIPTNNPTE